MKYEQFRFYRKYNEDKIIPALIKAEAHSEASKVTECGDYLRVAQCDNCGTNHFKSFNRCKSKFCSLCANVKSKIWVAHLIQYLEQWIQQGGYVIFCNYTIKDTETLEEGMNILEGAWRNMTGQQYRRLWKSYFAGGFRSIEVRTGKNSKQWHPHIHSILLKRGYSKDTMFNSVAWASSVNKVGGTCTNIPKMFPFTAYNKRDSRYKSKEDQTLALVKDVKEVCKYITKFEWTEEEPRRVRELVDTLKGKRQYTVWGVLADIRKQVNYLMDSKPDDELEDFVCQVCGCTKAHPNKVYSAIWHDDNFFIKDYATTPPKYIASDSLVETIRQRNNAVKHQDLNAIARVPEKPKSLYVQQKVMPEDVNTQPKTLK